MKRFRHILIILLILSAGLLVSCAQTHVDAEPENGTEVQIPDNSILSFTENDSISNLVDQIAKGEYPVEATVQYDSIDGCLSATVTDTETIKELYQTLSLVEVKGECNQSITDNYHYVSFKLSDESHVTFNFEGEHIWCLDKQNYTIENGEKLFTLMRELVEQSEPMQD